MKIISTGFLFLPAVLATCSSGGGSSPQGRAPDSRFAKAYIGPINSINRPDVDGIVSLLLADDGTAAVRLSLRNFDLGGEQVVDLAFLRVEYGTVRDTVALLDGVVVSPVFAQAFSLAEAVGELNSLGELGFECVVTWTAGTFAASVIDVAGVLIDDSDDV